MGRVRESITQHDNSEYQSRQDDGTSLREMRRCQRFVCDFAILIQYKRSCPPHPRPPQITAVPVLSPYPDRFFYESTSILSPASAAGTSCTLM